MKPRTRHAAQAIAAGALATGCLVALGWVVVG